VFIVTTLVPELKVTQAGRAVPSDLVTVSVSGPLQYLPVVNVNVGTVKVLLVSTPIK
jgi:hypothetical protein